MPNKQATLFDCIKMNIMVVVVVVVGVGGYGATVFLREWGVKQEEERKQFSLFYSEKGRNAASNYFGWDMKVKQGGG